jgi:serine/threonine protein kinase
MDPVLCARCNETLESGLAVCPACGGDPILAGRYRLEAEAAAGAMGTTYRAVRIEDSKPVAIKELALRRIDRAKTLELCEREARVLRQLDHPGIPAYLDDFHAGSGKQQAYYIVQEFIDGATLADELAAHRPNEREVLEIADELLEILSHLHSLSPPVIHRDIKPKNVMRRSAVVADDPHKRGPLVLIDFGSVRDAVRDPALGGSTIAGTLGYMAPEQFRGIATPASDLYALGVMMVVLLSGEPPEALLDHRNQLRWRAKLDHVRPVTLDLLERLLEPKPERRLKSALEAREKIETLRSVLNPALPPTPADQRVTMIDTESPIERIAHNVHRWRPEAMRARPPRRSKRTARKTGGSVALALSVALPLAFSAFAFQAGRLAHPSRVSSYRHTASTRLPGSVVEELLQITSMVSENCMRRADAPPSTHLGLRLVLPNGIPSRASVELRVPSRNSPGFEACVHRTVDGWSVGGEPFGGVMSDPPVGWPMVEAIVLLPRDGLPSIVTSYDEFVRWNWWNTKVEGDLELEQPLEVLQKSLDRALVRCLSPVMASAPQGVSLASLSIPIDHGRLGKIAVQPPAGSRTLDALTLAEIDRCATAEVSSRIILPESGSSSMVTAELRLELQRGLSF